MRIGLMCLMLAISAGAAEAQTVGDASLQPRAAMANCIAPVGEWVTPAEKTCYATTPDYEETMAYLRRVQGAALQSRDATGEIRWALHRRHPGDAGGGRAKAAGKYPADKSAAGDAG